jgi:hypothetical protein
VNAGNNDSVTIARTVYQAYVYKDRALMEPLVGEDLHSPAPVSRARLLLIN